MGVLLLRTSNSMFVIADNQREIAERLSQRNVAIYSDISYFLGDFEQFFDISGKKLQST